MWMEERDRLRVLCWTGRETYECITHVDFHVAEDGADAVGGVIQDVELACQRSVPVSGNQRIEKIGRGGSKGDQVGR